MLYWLIPLLSAVYLFGAGMVYVLFDEDSEAVGIAIFWPILLAAVLISAVPALIVLAGNETARFPEKHQERLEKKRQARRPDQAKIIRLEKENEIGQ